MSLAKVSYFANDVLSSPIKASAAPLTAVFLQPKWSVNMLTTGEQRKIMPMARAPTQAAEKAEKKIFIKKKDKKRGNCCCNPPK